MHAGAGVDRFETINGPEDGTEFAVTRAPFDIGGDPGCAVNARLDDDVKRYHARAAVVAKGYRIRSLAGAPIYVNGKRAGRIRSRIARNKDIVKAGRTEFVVHIAEGGLASRSTGMPTESDVAWALRSLGKGSLGIFGILRRLMGSGLVKWLVFLAIGTAVMSYFFPAFGATVRMWLEWAWAWTMYGMQRLMVQVTGG